MEACTVFQHYNCQQHHQKVTVTHFADGLLLSVDATLEDASNVYSIVDFYWTNVCSWLPHQEGEASLERPSLSSSPTVTQLTLNHLLFIYFSNITQTFLLNIVIATDGCSITSSSTLFSLKFSKFYLFFKLKNVGIFIVFILDSFRVRIRLFF